jgi:GNAT superfamily N-acetyltransferase
MYELKKTNGSDKFFILLVDLLDEDLNVRYGNLQKEYDKYNLLDSIKNVIIAFSNSEPVGCGSFKEYDNSTIEIKRMFVKPENRGTGLANKILHALEEWGSELGYKKSILETGIGQPEAIKFYTKCGYEKINNFGQYIGNSNSVCMSKNL